LRNLLVLLNFARSLLFSFTAHLDSQGIYLAAKHVLERAAAGVAVDVMLLLFMMQSLSLQLLNHERKRVPMTRNLSFWIQTNPSTHAVSWL